ncbi:erythromycin esterase family protein [Streptomonospora sp. PA3]|uniref:erythromycin esterase family protein n=1 Tax=Streptomonospora sp. PA3 TaxID=2607326 RepID=UPI0012DE6738|nr:erythromycin esterase family protein [Streptomonospora sp. PA3]MUL41298.1 erythromycin esterase family protein [Streptomonospora sp. PA3]
MDAATTIRDSFRRLPDAAALDPLLERVGDARFVLLGEASHGTSEFYGWRAAITERLVREKGFSLIAVEGDWPDCLHVHRHLADRPDAAEDTAAVLEGFARWPRWMWANEEILGLLRRLRERNAQLPPEERTGFFGLDVYSLWDSLQAVLDYLREHEPDQVGAAMSAYRCFEPYAGDERAYARSTALVPPGCADEVASLLTGMRQGAMAAETGSAGTAGDAGGSAERLAAVQNAEVVANAERYYRSMIGGGTGAWNIRDTHMADTLERLVDHYGRGAKAVVWAHNTHIGDARATDMAAASMVNLGQLMRERRAHEGVVAVGFGTHSGTVIAGRHWGADPEPMTVPPARAGSLEDRLHGVLHGGAAIAVFPESGEPPEWAARTLDHRAIGVVYRPAYEAWSNYVPTVAGRRYDAFVHCDRTSAVHPLHRAEPAPREPETYPSGV